VLHARYGRAHAGGNVVTRVRRFVDALVFSSIGVSLVAVALVAASSRALGVAVDPRALGLALVGTLAVYGIDRLRDLDRDEATSPVRTAFVLKNRTALVASTGGASLLALGFAVASGLHAVALLLPVLALGLAHRRLKRFAFVKPTYIVAAWLAVVVGLPWSLAAGAPGRAQPAHGGWVLAVLALSILPNAVAANVRDREAGAARLGPARALGIARALAAAGIVVGALAPGSVRTLVAVPAATLAALVPFRASERYGLVVVDGALLAGALIALALPAGSFG